MRYQLNVTVGVLLRCPEVPESVFWFLLTSAVASRRDAAIASAF